MKIEIKNGRILDPANSLDKTGSVWIDKGKLVSVLTKPDSFKADQIIDATGKWVLPGLVDLSARFCKPGQEFRSVIATESAAAASAGITSVCCPPDITPVIDTAAVVESLLHAAEYTGKVRIHPLGALTQGLMGERLAEMYTLRQAGCIAVSNGLMPLMNNEILRRALEYARSTDLTVFIYPEDTHLRNGGVVHEGEISTRLGLPPVPETTETVALASALLLIEQTGARVHFCRLSSARAVSMIKQAKRDGLPVTADIDIAHLFLTEVDVDDYNASFHMRPPLRRPADRQALEQGLLEGIIDAVCSEHQPLGVDAKLAPFSMTRPGGSSMEMLLPLMLDLAARRDNSPLTVLEKITSAPATIAGLPLGRLTPAAPADIIIVDPDRSWQARPEQLLSSGKYTPFADWELQGKVTHTLLDGKVIYQLD